MGNKEKEYRCSCGNLMAEGEAKTFTCCEECWDKHYEKKESVPVEKLGYSERAPESENQANGAVADTLEIKLELQDTGGYIAYMDALGKYAVFGKGKTKKQAISDFDNNAVDFIYQLAEIATASL